MPFNRTTVIGRIIEIHQAEFPDYTAMMYVDRIVEHAGMVAFVHKNDTISCRPNFIKDISGNVLVESEVNKGLILIYGMSPGDVVKAVVYYKGDERGREWRLMSCSKNTE
jgi:CHASE1-domain containing sensor protein